MFKSNRSKKGHGDWIGSRSVWDDPRAVAPTAPSIASKPAISTPKPFEINLEAGSRPTDSAIAPMFVEDTVTGDTRPASAAQLKFLKDLFAQRANNPVARALRLGALSVYKNGNLSVTAASDFIAEVKRIPRDN